MKIIDRHVVDISKATTQRCPTAKARKTSDPMVHKLIDLHRERMPEFDVDAFVKSTMERIERENLSKDTIIKNYFTELRSRRRIADDDTLVVILDDDGFGRDE